MKSKILSILVFSILSSEFFLVQVEPVQKIPYNWQALARAARVIADSRNNVVLWDNQWSRSDSKRHSSSLSNSNKWAVCKDDGTINGTPIASTTSDEFGYYYIKYKKTGTTMCVVVIQRNISVRVFLLHN